MTSNIQQLPEALVCKGISIRTTNNAEISHDTAKLGRLWQKFHQSHVSHLSEGADIYGIYRNYESQDLVGAFDVVASWEVKSEQAAAESVDVLSPENILSAANDSDVVAVTIPAGKYLVFSEEGHMPNTVMNAWEKAWEYFHDRECEHTRTYSVDFERYVEGNLEYGQVELYIGIE
ncbi:GyrI-like domain-containing protein [Psychrobacter frigidicola]|uniref:GyrI-like domain-containing protein n=1 Tax=Psychrobacter frigidicola TaxID=45611 RepID=A0A5C7A045_9GAMM|nr:GyrI-like domain-containing protein [Psychrobacter frigidicola]TXD96603.1 GyrI-like domain-containing protein [Psychrobacter frigidicola]